MNSHLLLEVWCWFIWGFWEVPEMNNEVICNSYLPGQGFPGIVKSCCWRQLNSDVNVDVNSGCRWFRFSVAIQYLSKLERVFIKSLILRPMHKAHSLVVRGFDIDFFSPWEMRLNFDSWGIWDTQIGSWMYESAAWNKIEKDQN